MLAVFFCARMQQLLQTKHVDTAAVASTEHRYESINTMLHSPSGVGSHMESTGSTSRGAPPPTPTCLC